MSTGVEYVSMESKRLLGLTDFRNNFLDHLRESIRDTHERVYAQDGVYDSALGLTVDGNDKFQITGTEAATDGQGHILGVADSGYNTGLQFENAAVDYYVGLRYNDRPKGIQINPRTGYPEYVSLQEFIGEKAAPDQVIDNGDGTITFVVDSVTETGITNAGRKVLAFKNVLAKNATTEAVAIEELTVAWTGTQNRITTAAAFGQTTVSTTAADYTVMLLGPTVKRNTDLRNSTEHVFIGIITGAGAGSPPSVFDITDQQAIISSLSQLSDITRLASNGRLKIEVKAITGESSEHQIRVKDSGGITKFWVDEAGNVKIEGNLEVTGTTTQQDVVQVNSSETVTDNLTAGDATGDSHLIKGTWRHTDPGGTANYFKVDGATGLVGINSDIESGYALKVGGKSKVTDTQTIEHIQPEQWHRETDIGIAVGGLWRSMVTSGDWYLEENTNVAGDFSTQKQWLRIDRGNGWIIAGDSFIPAADDTHDLGTSGAQWQDLWIHGQANIDEILVATGAGEGLGSDLFPDTDDTRDLGSNSRRYAEVHTRKLFLDNTANYGVGSDMVPTADATYDIGTASRRWGTIYANNVNFAGDFLPLADNTQDIGSHTARWAEGHFGNALHIGTGVALDANRRFHIEGGVLGDFAGHNKFADIGAFWSSNQTSAYRYGLFVNAVNNGDAHDAYGAHIEVSTSDDITHKMVGCKTYAEFFNGTCPAVYGSMSEATSNLNQSGLSQYGTQATSYVGSSHNTSTIQLVVGGEFIAQSVSAAGGTITELKGINAKAIKTHTGIVTHLHGGYFDVAATTTGTTMHKYGIEIGNVNGANSYNYGLKIGNVFCNGNGTYGIHIGNISGDATSSYGVRVGNVTATGDDAAGISIGSITGAAGDNYGISIGSINSGTTNNCGIRMGLVSGAAVNENYGIKIGGAGGADVLNFGIRVGAVTGGASATNSGVCIDSVITTTTGTNYGLLVGNVLQGATNYAIKTGQGSVVFGAPVGGAMGDGTLNAVAVYDDGSLLTDYVFDKHFDGKVREEDVEKHDSFEVLPLAKLRAHLRTHRHLPTIPGRRQWTEEGRLSLGQLNTRLWETAEVHAIYLTQLHDRIKQLEAHAKQA